MEIHKSNLTFDDLPVGIPVKVISEIVDFNFFYGETGVVTNNNHGYLGVTIKFDQPRRYEDGYIAKEFNFNPCNLEIIEKAREQTMQPITKQDVALEPRPFDEKVMEELLNDPAVKEVRVFKPNRGDKIIIRGVPYKILSFSKNGDLHLKKVE
jgi:virulence-associated protein VagC